MEQKCRYAGSAEMLSRCLGCFAKVIGDCAEDCADAGDSFAVRHRSDAEVVCRGGVKVQI